MRTEGLGAYALATIILLVMAGIIATMILFPNGLPGSAAQKTITIRASGAATGYPAEGIVYLEINRTGQTPAIATANLSLSVAELNNTLLKYANSSNISTTYYSLSKITNSSMYEAIEGIQVKAGGAAVGPILGAVSSINGIAVTGASSRLSSKQSAELMAQALSAAMANATSQAEILAGTNSVTAENITSYSYIYPYPIFASAGLASVPAAPNNPSFFAGTQAVTEQVTVVFKSS